MKKREDEEKQKEEEQQVYGCSVSSKAKAVPTCYYLVQSPSSVSSSLCRSVVNHHHHHHHSHLLTSSKPAINPVLVAHHHDDNDDEDDEEDGNVSAGSNYRITKTTTSFNMNIMSRCSSSRASLTSIFLEDQDDQHSLLNNNNHHHLIPLLPPLPPPNHHHYDDASAILVNNANENPTFPTPTTKLIAYQYHHHHGRHIKEGDDDDDDDDDDEKPGGGCCCRYLSSKTFPSSNLWIALQLLWRLFFSFMVALLVFYLATKPPSPHVSIQVGGVKQFELAEGVDSSGVGTNFLTCNLSMVVVIDNKSKVYSLHLHPLRLAIYFGRIPLVVSQQEGREEEEVKNEEKREIRVSGGVTGKAMYGAGREMEDALKTTEKGGNLELVTKVSVESYYRVVGNLIRPKFHHRALCFVSLHNFYDHQHATQAFNSTCRLSVS